jgi:hypothetical protein
VPASKSYIEGEEGKWKAGMEWCTGEEGRRKVTGEVCICCFGQELEWYQYQGINENCCILVLVIPSTFHEHVFPSCVRKEAEVMHMNKA